MKKLFIFSLLVSISFTQVYVLSYTKGENLVAIELCETSIVTYQSGKFNAGTITIIDKSQNKISIGETDLSEYKKLVKAFEEKECR